MAQISTVIDALPVSGLQGTAPVSLSDWYGDPLAATAAEAWLTQVWTRQQAHLRAGMPCFQLQILAMVCHDWLDSEPELDYAQLAALAADDYERALLELVRGQLLASRKISGAMGYLQNGFRLAAALLDSTEYFALLHRHELLDCLPYSEKPSAPQDLASLLNESAVINKLRSGEHKTHACMHQDTVG